MGQRENYVKSTDFQKRLSCKLTSRFILLGLPHAPKWSVLYVFYKKLKQWFLSWVRTAIYWILERKGPKVTNDNQKRSKKLCNGSNSFSFFFSSPIGSINVQNCWKIWKRKKKLPLKLNCSSRFMALNKQTYPMVWNCQHFPI